jgi:hypothetical protein
MAMPDDMFTQKWWVKNRDAFLIDPGLDKKLKAYEVAADLMDYGKMRTALKEVSQLVKTTLDLCNKHATVHAKTIVILKNYPVEIKKKEAKIDLDEANFKKNAKPDAGEEPVEPQKVGAPVVVYQCDISKEVLSFGQIPWRLADYKVNLTINSDILDLLEKKGGHSTAAAMVADAQDLCKAVANKISSYAAKDVYSHPPKTNEERDGMTAKLKAYVDAQVKELSEQLTKIPGERWNKWLEQKKQYKAYKLQVGKSVGLGTLAVVGSLAAVGTAAPTMGASLAPAIIAAVKSIAEAVKLGLQLWKEAETVQKELQKDLAVLKESYLNAEGKAKKTMGAKEVGKAVLKEATLGIGDVAAELGLNSSWLKTLPKCKEDFSNLTGKVSHLVINNQSQTKHALRALADTEKLQEEMKKAENAKDAGKIFDQLVKLRKGINENLEGASSLGGRIRSLEKALPELEKGLKELTKENPTYSEVFGTYFPTVVSLFLAAANATAGVAAAASLADAGGALVIYASDLVAVVGRSVSAGKSV